MNLKELEEKLALTASEQSRNNGLAQNCPRCGMTAIKHSLASNALSRNHKIYICDACGTAEALTAANNSHEPLSGWAFAQDGFALLPGTAPVKASELACGTECWGWQYQWPLGMSMPTARMAPTRGILSARCYEGDEAMAGTPAWFIPYVKNTRKPAWTKAIRLEFVNIHSTKAAAVTAHDNAIAAVAARLRDIAAMAEADMAGRKENNRSARTGRLIVAGRASKKNGACAWTAIVLEDAKNGTVSTASGCFGSEKPDAYMSELHALEMGAKAAKIAGITKLDVYAHDEMVLHNIHYLASEAKSPDGYIDYFDNGVLLRDPTPQGGSPDDMKDMVDQAVKMALNRMYGTDAVPFDTDSINNNDKEVPVNGDA